MTYRKLKATGLFTGYQMLDDQSVLVISQDGNVGDILPIAEAGEGVEHFQGILSPGFINCHCHLELSHLKGLIPEKTGLVDFVVTVVTQRHFPEPEIAAAIARAEDEMLANGIQAVGDICNNLLTISQKMKRRMDYYNFIEVSGWLPALADSRFDRSLNFYEAFGHPRETHAQRSLSPHAPYSVSEPLWNLLMPHFTGKTVTIHNQETAWEDEFFKFGTGEANRMYQMLKFENPLFQASGKSSLQSFLPRMDGSRNILLVHNTFTREEDLAFCEQSPLHQHLYFCLCPNANLYIENMLPPIDTFRKYQCKMVLGTDSLASNHALNILEEAKTIRKHFPNIPQEEILQWCTINGAQALQLAGNLGSFERGKEPGVLLIENTPNGQLGEGSTVRRIL